MLYKISASVAALALSVNLTIAQFQLPRFDVELKATQIAIPADQTQTLSLKSLETTNLHMGAHVQINQHIALGWFYSSSMRGQGYNYEGFKFKFGNGDSNASTLLYGPDLRISAGRARNWRPYLSLNYSFIQVVEDRGSYRLSTKSTAFGESIGLMKRFGNHLYWNVLEIGMRQLSQQLFWADTKAFLEAKMGFTYNIGKRK
jgi:hypothetical protein